MTMYCWRCARLVWADDELPKEPHLAFCRKCKAKNIIPAKALPIGDTAQALDRLPRHVLESVLTTA